MINFEDFLEDFSKAVELYFIDLDSDTSLQQKFMTRFKKGGLVARTGSDFSKKELGWE